MTPVRFEYVPVEPFQRRYAELVAEGFSASQIAMQIGFKMKKVKRGRTYIAGDTSRLKRLLGLMKWDHRTPEPATHMKYHNAVKLCMAWGMDPVDAGV